MFKLAYTAPEKATGQIKEIYDTFPPAVGVPAPMQLFSVSPGAMALQAGSVQYFRTHPELEFPLLAAIRFIAASELCYDFCVGFNSGMLQRVGMNEVQLQSLLGDLRDVPFEDKEVALLRLVQKVVRAPQAVTAQDVDACRAEGWSDSVIFDACLQAANMSVHARLMTAFAA